MKYYIKKLSKQDKSRTMVLNKEAVTNFFNLSLLKRDDEATINIIYSGNENYENIRIVLKQDYRIFIDRNLFNIEDIAIFEKNDSDGTVKYRFNVISTNSIYYNEYVNILANSYTFLDKRYQLIVDKLAKIEKENIDNENKTSIASLEYKIFKKLYRKKQGTFRKQLLLLYDNKCAISNYDAQEGLEAAHIDAFSNEGNNDIDNGIILRSDLHDLFDRQLLKINPNTFKVEIDKSINNTKYRIYHDIKLNSRNDGKYPNKNFLTTKYNQ